MEEQESDWDGWELKDVDNLELMYLVFGILEEVLTVGSREVL